ncbi:hypothetical protein C0993_011856 [Termitomyces sp. T159_Od127]|nr:hypothetical protein C0993_011856 [Termitomyces sp. T159_Od127]
MTLTKLPTFTKSLTVKKAPAQGNPVYHDAVIEQKPIPALKRGEVLVKIGAAAFNHRDVWIRKGQYPRIAFGSVFGADGAGTVVAAYEPNDPLLKQRVFLTPSRGWEKHPDGPESDFGILGGVSYPALGTFTEYVVVERDQVISSPKHLNDVQMAAWPLGAVTAWRASVVNGLVSSGQNVLITGIGGGVALLALQMCLAKGASVYVTSGSQDKIQKAIALGAKGGMRLLALLKTHIHAEDWPARLDALLGKGRELDVVIDSGGGEIMMQTDKLLKHGGRSTMGSHQDLIDATDFMAEHRIIPVISHVFEGLEAAEQGFETMKRGEQFGKIVVKIGSDTEGSVKAKL